LDEVADSVIEGRDDHGADVHRRLGKHDAEAGETLVLGSEIVDAEAGPRDAVGDQRVTERPDRRMLAGLERDC